MKYLSLTIPGTDGTPVQIIAPSGIPTGPQYTIGNIATVFFQVAMVVGILLSLSYFIFGGWLWMQSEGDKQKLHKARNAILYSLIGLATVSLALVIVNIVGAAFGIENPILNIRGTR